MGLTPVSCATILISNMKSIWLAFFYGQFRGTGPWPTCLCELAYWRSDELPNPKSVAVCVCVSAHTLGKQSAVMAKQLCTVFMKGGGSERGPIRLLFGEGEKFLGCILIHCFCGRPLFLLSAQ